MLNVLILATWIATGVWISVALSPRSEPRWAWAPVAAFLGPLWLSVALDRRAAVPRAATPPRRDWY